jgi:hypothetical protein
MAGATWKPFSGVEPIPTLAMSLEKFPNHAFNFLQLDTIEIEHQKGTALCGPCSFLKQRRPGLNTFTNPSKFLRKLNEINDL